MKRFLIVVVFAAGVAIGCTPPATSPATRSERETHATPNASESSAPPPGQAPDGMTWIPGGEFWMGSDDGPLDEQPRHLVRITGFWIDRTEVTNAAFAKFVEATGYKTVAERQPDRKNYPTARAELLVPGAAVFQMPKGEVDLRALPVWWAYVPGACWRRPDGPGSDIKNMDKHPVVQIAWEDATAYAKWAGKRLPTEAEWEHAARGGLDRKQFCWGDEFRPNGKYMANTWQGRFPTENSKDDGYVATAPVGSYPANGFGLFDMSGNVWEWCSDWYDPRYYLVGPKINPRGPEYGVPSSETGQPERVRRGGSFLCSDDYCRRYLPAARDKNPPDSSANHTGFRCVKDR